MWCHTGQEGLWFTAGRLAQCRIYSKDLAPQIKAWEQGLLVCEPREIDMVLSATVLLLIGEDGVVRVVAALLIYDL